MKTFKEYTEYMGGVRLGNYSRYHPMASLGDSPPKNFVFIDIIIHIMVKIIAIIKSKEKMKLSSIEGFV